MKKGKGECTEEEGEEGATARNQRSQRSATQRNAPQQTPSNDPTLPIPAQQTQHLPLAHGILTSKLQYSTTADVVIAFESVRVGRSMAASEFQADAVGQFLLVEVWGVGGLEVGEVEFFPGAGLRLAWLLGGWRGEV